ncbi:hypothetical protein F4813DRAFT_345479 [Daldinia decipiens]|uniref:uncharacterized protein n=1 Tax=Daldinia decipiens TaxID=326647 RepID=UPI0020C547BE|nr:uncharacterized protein F4813DRAFT_345479 [Daldinia decipiens]KAI1661704.1 hypothetical protein F4813DRAFT_345479 [Daldinia decipiens]
MRWFLTLPTSLLLSIALQTQVSLAIVNDFSAYPEDSQQCLNDAADASKCTGNTGNEMNRCLCANKGNFIYNTAECVAKESPADLNAVYDTMEFNCAGTGVTIAVSKQAFLSQAAAATATATTSSATPTSTSPTSTLPTSASPTSASDSPTASPTSSDSPSGGSTLSSGAKLGLGVGIGFGSAALGLLGWFVFAYSRRRRADPAAAAAAAANNSPHQHDVELSPNAAYTMHNNGSSLYAPSPLTPSPAYAHYNTQFGGVAELSPATVHSGCKELPADYYGGGDKKNGSGGGTGGGYNYKRSSGVPLLAELEDGRASSPAPVELPGSEVYNDTSSVHTPTRNSQSPEGGYRDQGLGNGHGAG